MATGGRSEWEIIELQADRGEGPSLPHQPLQQPNVMTEVLSEIERQRLRDAGREEYEIKALAKSIKRTLDMRKEHWTTDPPGLNTDFPTRLPKEPIRIAIVGSGGVGKSKLSTLLVGRENVFVSSDKPTSETQEVQGARFVYEGQTFEAYDTPGYSISDLPRENIVKRTQTHAALKRGAERLQDGAHVFIFVMSGANPQTYEREIRILQTAEILNPNTFHYFMAVITHSKMKYDVNGRQNFIRKMKATEAETGGSTTITDLLNNINDRVVLVELGTNNEANIIYDSEREQARRMIMAMVSNIIENNRNNERSIIYPTQSILTDLEEARSWARARRRRGTEGGCFPEHASVRLVRGKKLMKDLQLHDEVCVVNDQGQIKYEPIILFSHAKPTEQACFICIHTTNGKDLLLTREHLIHVGRLGNLKAAQEVKAGDIVFTFVEEHGGKLVQTTVTCISSTWDTGLFSPKTPGLSIIVDDVAASCLTDHLPRALPYMAMYPVCIFHRVLPYRLYDKIFSSDSSIGMPWILYYCRKVIRSFEYFTKFIVSESP